MCDEKRQEFILLSDTLGDVDGWWWALEQAQAVRRRSRPTRPKWRPPRRRCLGPFFWEGAPELALGADITGVSNPATPGLLPRAASPTRPASRWPRLPSLDVWSGDGDGFYDHAKRRMAAPMALRARFHTDDNGNYRYLVHHVRPTTRCPTTAPWAACCRRMGRHPNRPGHMHTMLQRRPATSV